MNILVIGNGFDLAHDLPTSYSDVLNFLQAINITSKWRGEKNEFINTHLSNKNFNSYVSDYIINAFDSRTKKEIVPLKILILLSKNYMITLIIIFGIHIYGTFILWGK